MAQSNELHLRVQITPEIGHTATPKPNYEHRTYISIENILRDNRPWTKIVEPEIRKEFKRNRETGFNPSIHSIYLYFTLKPGADGWDTEEERVKVYKDDDSVFSKKIIKLPTAPPGSNYPQHAYVFSWYYFKKKRTLEVQYNRRIQVNPPHLRAHSQQQPQQQPQVHAQSASQPQPQPQALGPQPQPLGAPAPIVARKKTKAQLKMIEIIKIHKQHELKEINLQTAVEKLKQQLTQFDYNKGIINQFIASKKWGSPLFMDVYINRCPNCFHPIRLGFAFDLSPFPNHLKSCGGTYYWTAFQNGVKGIVDNSSYKLKFSFVGITNYFEQCLPPNLKGTFIP
eukprot:152622_1